MPRTTDRKASISIYPERMLRDHLVVLAEKNRRSLNAQVLAMLETHPDLKGRRNGKH